MVRRDFKLDSRNCFHRFFTKIDILGICNFQMVQQKRKRKMYMHICIYIYKAYMTKDHVSIPLSYVIRMNDPTFKISHKLDRNYQVVEL